MKRPKNRASQMWVMSEYMYKTFGPDHRIKRAYDGVTAYVAFLEERIKYLDAVLDELGIDPDEELKNGRP
jgi:hypothetical protein